MEWFVEKDINDYSVNVDNGRVAGYIESREHAHLISAAPEMLDVLKGLLHHIEQDLPNYYAELLKKRAEAVIAKAEGKEPSYADVIVREVAAHTFKLGDDVETLVDAGAAGSQWLRGSVIKAGPTTYTVHWVTGTVNRIQQGYRGIRRAELRDILGPDDSKEES